MYVHLYLPKSSVPTGCPTKVKKLSLIDNSLEGKLLGVYHSQWYTPLCEMQATSARN